MILRPIRTGSCKIVVHAYCVKQYVKRSNSYYNSSYIAFHDDLVSHLITWHARQSHTEQDMIVRLARVSFLELLDKVHLPTGEPCLAESY